MHNINDRHTNTGMASEDVWDIITQNLGDNNLVTAGSRQAADGTDSHNLASGVVSGHAYTVVRTKILSNKTKIVVLRNPHGKDSYWGAESNNYDTDAEIAIMKAEIPEVDNPNDGLIFVPLD